MYCGFVFTLAHQFRSEHLALDLVSLFPNTLLTLCLYSFNKGLEITLHFALME